MDEEQKTLRRELTKCLRERSKWENRYFVKSQEYKLKYGGFEEKKPKPEKKKKAPKPKLEKTAGKPKPKKAASVKNKKVVVPKEKKKK